ncbi:bifunctional ADP-dependent NAD(P)H-hydrate dehydratase/NAD(P)H-hydrate epimerase [Marinobacter sp. HL-58]|uniref:bifunctional ADP-dependent NAD(P)H-hydrate dehydratase/NAD(P)H-hydrate epimerase n=1 Tax=Marinobacter sp. HL-58 TaxID=1479237 RepID=UPI00047F9651|nr:bifunctional ADP-dependent NAD(P)H-hydrate dehydratase/NAD(P)H-hydrate epimerase [Marinobacter sp. HL-58]KPP99839.1 MAG: ADP-dependent NAD(P)H-hydrate dehydratase [Marinobacter sp. HL-58]
MPLSGGHSLPEDLYSADAVREIDRYVIDQQGVDGFELMQAAAASAFRRLVRYWPEPGRILVLCGAGNNGGDGYLVAANAVRHGLSVDCIAVAPTEKLSGDARKAWKKSVADGVPVKALADLSDSEVSESIASAGLIVDAMLGTGVTGAPREPFAAMIRHCNGAAAPVLGIDLPSGLNASTGTVAGDAVRADVTVTFIGLKAGLFTGQGAEFAGDVVFESLDTDDWASESGQQPLAHRVDWSRLHSSLPRRPKAAHKGRFGHVLIVAGDRGLGGAGMMAAEAASRSGAGMVTLATRPEYVAPALARCPSVMVQGLIHGSELPPLISAADVIVCGPGIGQGAWGQQMLQQVVASGKPRVLDADALNLMASRVAQPADNHILTPHPGEAARLLECTVADIESDRIRAAEQIHELFGGVVLLKGAGTIVASGGVLPDIISGSNPGMATGGMGDVLSGILGSFYAQFGNARLSASAAAALHLEAANRASGTRGYMGLLPMDVIDALPQVLMESEQAAAVGGNMKGVAGE